MTPSAGLIHLLDGLTQLREMFYLLDSVLLQRILKDTNQQPDEKIQRARSFCS